MEVSCNVDSQARSASDISTYYNWPTNRNVLLNNTLQELTCFDSNTHKTLENKFRPSNFVTLRVNIPKNILD